MKIVKNIEKVNENLGKISDKEAEDAFKTMNLVFKIYYSDKKWRTKYNIKNPVNF